MKDKLRAWLSDDLSGMEQFLDTSDRPDARREDIEREDRRWREDVLSDPATREAIRRGRERARGLYRVVAVAGCIVFILAILFVIAHLPRFGEYAPQMAEVADRYIGSGLEETGATNIVAGMILDYRAFDTLGESFVLFTALICSTVLLRLDAKNQRSGPDSYGSIRSQAYFDTSSDRILRLVGTAAVPVILVFGRACRSRGHTFSHR